MLPVVVVDFDPSASQVQQQTVLESCNRALSHSECVAGDAADARPARAIAVVSWPDPGRAHIELGLPSLDRWVTHDLEFEREEPTSERWRAVGFTIATLVGDEPSEEPANSPETADPAEPVATEPPAPRSAGIRLGPRIGFGIDREVTLGGVEGDCWASPFTSWTPVLGVTYVGPLSPEVGLHWRELELALGAALRRRTGAVEWRTALRLTAKRIAVSSDGESLSAWVPGAELFGELRWPAADFWTLSARLRTQWNDGATGIRRAGDHVASSPAWIFGGSAGLEVQF